MAAVLGRDARHREAVTLVRGLIEARDVRTFTSDYVIVEALNYLRARRAPASIENRFLMLTLGPKAPIVDHVIRITPGRFAHAMARFAKFHDQGLSFTDCSTLVAMQDEDVRTLATFDGAFKGLVDTLGLD